MSHIHLKYLIRISLFSLIKKSSNANVLQFNAYGFKDCTLIKGVPQKVNLTDNVPEPENDDQVPMTDNTPCPQKKAFEF